MIVKIGIEQVERITFGMARQLFTFDEPIPDFDTRLPNILESCVETPFQVFDGEELYPTLTAKASIMFYLMIKNHPFNNGNKRIALTTLLTFLYANDKFLNVHNDTVYDFTVWVAASLPEAKNGTVISIEDFIKKHLVDKDFFED